MCVGDMSQTCLESDSRRRRIDVRGMDASASRRAHIAQRLSLIDAHC